MTFPQHGPHTAPSRCPSPRRTDVCAARLCSYPKPRRTPSFCVSAPLCECAPTCCRPIASGDPAGTAVFTAPERRPRAWTHDGVAPLAAELRDPGSRRPRSFPSLCLGFLSCLVLLSWAQGDRIHEKHPARCLARNGGSKEQLCCGRFPGPRVPPRSADARCAAGNTQTPTGSTRNSPPGCPTGAARLGPSCIPAAVDSAT